MLVHFAYFLQEFMRPMTPYRQTSKSVPVFDLYGEERQHATLDPIHVESIAARSSLHNWEIRPHRHHGLFQLLWLEQGDAQLVLDDAQCQLRAGSVVMVPQHCVHGFRFARDASGLVLTLAYPMLAGMVGDLGRQLLGMSAPRVCPLAQAGARAQVRRLLQLLTYEYGRQGAFRTQLLEALVTAVLVFLLRQPEGNGDEGSAWHGPVPSQASAHLARFTAEIERSFSTHAPLSHYASALGLSAAHLNFLCRQYAGRSATTMIHDRLLLEARRNLVYTAMSVREVAEMLGFSDPAYFTRFFKRATGLAPTTFRGRTGLPAGVT